MSREGESPDLVAALEAVLFMAAEPLAAKELGEILGVSPAEAESLAARLETACAGRGLKLALVAGGYELCTRPEYAEFVARLHQPHRFRLSRAALETLAIIAYRQPVTRPEIEAIRGVNSDGVISTLLNYRLIREAGRKEAPGRPVLYRTTEDFLLHFGLGSVGDLPRLDALPAPGPEEGRPGDQNEPPPHEEEAEPNPS
jgi:segregation and condensation protein B